MTEWGSPVAPLYIASHLYSYMYVRSTYTIIRQLRSPTLSVPVPVQKMSVDLFNPADPAVGAFYGEEVLETQWYLNNLAILSTTEVPGSLRYLSALLPSLPH